MFRYPSTSSTTSSRDPRTKVCPLGPSEESVKKRMQHPALKMHHLNSDFFVLWKFMKNVKVASTIRINDQTRFCTIIVGFELEPK